MKSNHKVSVEPHQGRTAICVDGKAIPGMSFLGAIYNLDNSQTVYTREMAQAGVSTMLVPWHFHKREGFEVGWSGPGEYNFAMFDLWAKRICDSGPEIRIVPRLYIDTPHWWSAAHPGELTTYAHDPAHPPKPVGEHRNPAQASMASKQWIADVSEVIRAFVAHAENGPWADRILGYCINSGGTEEWVYWGVQPGYVPDYSGPALEYYRNWLRKKYGGQAWIDKAQIPSEAQRRSGQPGLLRDPAVDRAAIDYELCLSEIVVDNLLAWCKVVKEATHRKRIVGTFCNYVMWQTGLVNPSSTNAHLALRKVLDSPDIDFITGITSYDNRGPGEAGTFMVPMESIQKAGKITFNEVDVRTHNTQINSSMRYQATGLIHLGPLKDAEESVDVLRREFSHHLIHGSPWWYFDMAGGWYSGPEILADFKRQAQITREALAWDMSSVAQVAGIVSASSPAYHPLMRMHDVNNYRELLELQCDRATQQLYRSGVELDWLTCEDLDSKEMEKYKVLYFYNATWLSAKQRKAIDGLKKDGRVLVFVGYPGLATDDKLDTGAATALTGMNFKLDGRRFNGELTPLEYGDPSLRDLKTKLVLGTGAVVGPRLLPVDGEAATIAYWPDGAPGAAVKRFADWTSFYFPVPLNNQDLFRTICRDAGCHIYTGNGDVVYANKSLVMVHFVDCIQPLHLPRAAKATNLFTGEVVLENGTMLVPSGPNGTHLYRIE